jgi:hypothetical protein
VKIILSSLLALSLVFSCASSHAQQDDSPADDVTIKAYRQDGYYCGYWDDCQGQEGDCDGIYGLRIRIENDIFLFTLELPDRQAELAVFGLPVGTPINYDFKGHFLMDPDDEWFHTYSLTRVQPTGEPDQNACPAPGPAPSPAPSPAPNP